MESKHPEIAIIVAMDRNRAIGLRGDMPWRLSADLKRFKKITMGHPVIMGRKTFESLPGGALPGRKNIVITKSTGFNAENVIVAESPERALDLCSDAGKVFVIGGGIIYRHFINIADLLYLTVIQHDYQADTWFPEFNTSEFDMVGFEEINNDPKFSYPYQFIDYRRKI